MQHAYLSVIGEAVIVIVNELIPIMIIDLLLLSYRLTLLPTCMVCNCPAMPFPCYREIGDCYEPIKVRYPGFFVDPQFNSVVV